MLRTIFLTAILVSAALFAGKSGFATQPHEALLIVAGIDNQTELAALASRFGRGKFQFAKLDKSVLALAARLSEEIGRGQIHEDGEGSPPHLRKFSDAVLAAVPKIREYGKIHVISPVFLPVELVHQDGIFVGDTIPVSHEYMTPTRRSPEVPQPRDLPLSSYVIEAVIGMPRDMPRAKQDIVQVALSLEQELPVELHFNSGLRKIRRVLARDDVGILHIDTHGGEKGGAIQISRNGGMMSPSDIPAKVRIPLILLFGCEGVANGQAFGSVMRERGTEAVISSFAKFESFGITGDTMREERVCIAFFAALRVGENVGKALLRFRKTAKEEMTASGSRRTLTRLFFVLIGNGDLRFDWPAPVN